MTPTRIEKLRRWGPGRFLYGYLAALLRRLGLRVFVVVRRPHHGVSAEHTGSPDIDMRLVEWDELFELAADPELDLDAGFLTAAKARGDICVGAFDGGRLVSYLWRAFHPLPAEEGFWVRFDPPNRYGYKAFTRPSHRGLRIQSALAPTTDRMLLERGYTHAISYVESDNYASIRSDVHHGNVRIGYAGWFNGFGLRRTFSTPGAREHGFEFFDPGPTASS